MKCLHACKLMPVVATDQLQQRCAETTRQHYNGHKSQCRQHWYTHTASFPVTGSALHTAHCPAVSRPLLSRHTHMLLPVTFTSGHCWQRRIGLCSV